MNPTNQIYPFYQRGISLALLVMFCVSVLLSFSLFIDLKPAKAVIFDMPRWLKWALEKVYDFLKGVAKAFILKFAQNFLTKIVQKLESIHVIKNFLFYADALGFDKYVGSALNKTILKPFTKEEAEELESDTNIGKIAFDAQQKLNLDPKQAEKLAYLSKQSGVIYSFVFNVTKKVIKPGESVAFNWAISGSDLATANFCEDKVNFAGAKSVKPSETTTYKLAVIGGDKKIVSTKSITIQVEGSQTTKTCSLANSGVLPGLSASQEKNLLRGTLASLSSQVACGATDGRLIRNMAIYNAAKTRGFDPREIDPTSGNYYTQMARLGNPFASPDFQELAMRDTAASIDAQAQAAVQQELSSNGLKALRAEQNQITRSSQAISDTIGNAIGQMFANVSWSSEASFASSVGSVLADTVTNVIFQSKGTVLADNPLCGIGVLASQNIYAGGIDAGQIGNMGAANIAVNGQSAIGWKQGDSPVVLSWSVELTDETKNSTVSISNLPAECSSANFAPVNGVVNGSCQFTPTKDLIMELELITGGRVDTYGVATVSIETPAAPDITAGGGVGSQETEVSPAFRVRE